MSTCSSISRRRRYSPARHDDRDLWRRTDALQGPTFGSLARVLKARPHLKFLVLTNGQHFGIGDLRALRRLPRDCVTWGVPIYSDDAGVHDRIVGKPGAFERLSAGRAILARTGCSVELRTVVTRENVDGMTALAHFIVANTPFVSAWAIMQLENIGFGRMNWDQLFHNHCLGFKPIGAAIDIARSWGIEALL